MLGWSPFVSGYSLFFTTLCFLTLEDLSRRFEKRAVWCVFWVAVFLLFGWSFFYGVFMAVTPLPMWSSVTFKFYLFNLVGYAAVYAFLCVLVLLVPAVRPVRGS